jgi:hypothetical protein
MFEIINHPEGKNKLLTESYELAFKGKNILADRISLNVIGPGEAGVMSLSSLPLEEQRKCLGTFDLKLSQGFGRTRNHRMNRKEKVEMSINASKDKHEEQLMRLPNVTGIGIGEKAGKAVIKVFVTHKVPESDLRPREIVPRSIDGYETDRHPAQVLYSQQQPCPGRQ